MTVPWTPRFPVTPWNTWSNLAYPIAGLTHWALAPSWPAAVFALLQAGLGYGSYRYHKGPTPYTNRLDWSGMYATMGYAALFAWFPGEPWIALSGAIIAGILVAFFVWRDRKKFTHFDWHMGVLFLLAAVPGFLWGDRTAALVSTGLFALGFLAWQLERTQVLDQGHGFWHCLTAAAQPLLLVAR